MSAIPVASGWNKSGVSWAIELDEQTVIGPAVPFKLDCGHTIPLIEKQRFSGTMRVLRVTLQRTIKIETPVLSVKAPVLRLVTVMGVN